jgi:DNA modification methylase
MLAPRTAPLALLTSDSSPAPESSAVQADSAPVSAVTDCASAPADEATEWLRLCQAVVDKGFATDDERRRLAGGLAERHWRCLRDSDGVLFESVADLCVAPRPFGVGCTPAVLNDLMRVPEAVPAPLESGPRRRNAGSKPAGKKAHRGSTPPTQEHLDKPRQRPPKPKQRADKKAKTGRFDEACSRIRTRLAEADEVAATLTRNHFEIADLFAEAKAIYEKETGTGQGKRNPARIPSFVEAMAQRLGWIRGASRVQKYLRLAQMDAATRDRAASSAIRHNLTSLLDVVREPDPARRATAVAAYDVGGSDAVKATLKGAIPGTEDSTGNQDGGGARREAEATAKLRKPQGTRAARPSVVEVDGAATPQTVSEDGKEAGDAAASKPRATQERRAEVALVAGAGEAANLYGRRVAVRWCGNRIVLEDIGEADPNPPAPPTPRGPGGLPAGDEEPSDDDVLGCEDELAADVEGTGMVNSGNPPAPLRNPAAPVIHQGDNLPILKGMAPEVVDLVYGDILYGTQRTFYMRGENGKRVESYSDGWKWGSEADEILKQLRDGSPTEQALASTIDLAGTTPLGACLAFTAPRLLQMHRVLRPTGSIWIQCDPTASHYVKVMLDQIFGHAKFRSDVPWKRTRSHNIGRKPAPVHDDILFYTKSRNYTWNPPTEPTGSRKRDKQDPDGRWYALGKMHARRNGTKTVARPWRGFLPPTTEMWIVSAAVRAEYVSRTGMELPTDVLKAYDALDAAGLIIWSEGKRRPRFKMYRDRQTHALPDVWVDVDVVCDPKEVTGFETQKPVKLLERIVHVSSNPGDVVLDAFMGSGTTGVAAMGLGRSFVGIEQNPETVRLARKRLGIVDDVLTAEPEPADQVVVEAAPETSKSGSNVVPLVPKDASRKDFEIFILPDGRGGVAQVHDGELRWLVEPSYRAPAEVIAEAIKLAA